MIERGLTPPHRVKSISMATFTQDEIGVLESKGNDYCRKVWLGLFEGTPPTGPRDEQAVKDFMTEKYEKKRYYLDPSQVSRNGHHNKANGVEHQLQSRTNGVERPRTNKITSEPKPILTNKYNGLQNSNRRRPEVSGSLVRPTAGNSNDGSGDFVANFETADIFSASNNNYNATNSVGVVQQGFANFDNNPVFSNGTTVSNGFPSASLQNTISQQQHVQNTISNNIPTEDRYAALKDLDNALKSQSTLDWSSSGSNGSLYSSPTPTGSMYSNPSPQGSLFGSPSQGQFFNGFAGSQETNGMISNPFGNNGFSWTNGKSNALNGGLNGTNGYNIQNNYQNPFRVSELNKMNGFSHMVQPAGLQMGGDIAWTPNPFKVGATTLTSNNPFL
ncbi:hypothetical protein WA026_022081 [Henosepilachna vigintioctopunctata]|uniref:Arf-GAP domain-containing protein n=1 Tax=Henosepilachna vigintioctopunctata TaxID=420089 RepID=A0AAW1U3T0_9CUCU